MHLYSIMCIELLLSGFDFRSWSICFLKTPKLFFFPKSILKYVSNNIGLMWSEFFTLHTNVHPATFDWLKKISNEVQNYGKNILISENWGRVWRRCNPPPNKQCDRWASKFMQNFIKNILFKMGLVLGVRLVTWWYFKRATKHLNHRLNSIPTNQDRWPPTFSASFFKLKRFFLAAASVEMFGLIDLNFKKKKMRSRLALCEECWRCAVWFDAFSLHCLLWKAPVYHQAPEYSLQRRPR